MTPEVLEFTDISSSRVSTDQQSKVLALVKEFPFRTAAELAHKVNSDTLSHDAIHKRLPELRHAGKVFNGMRRNCTITGRRAQTWTVI